MAWGYQRAYFVGKQQAWDASGAAVAEVLTRLLPLRSAVEFGCGTANLLAALAARGVEDVLGLHGPHDPPDLMRLPAERLAPWDLDRLQPLPRRFDLACTIEVGEHIPAARARAFVAMLVAAAPVVLFGAAIAGQGGEGHVNERRQAWWAELFAAHGYLPVDCVRPAIWGAPGMEWYYVQNLLLYCAPGHLPAGHAPVTSPLYLNLVHDRVMQPLLRGPEGIRGAVSAMRRDGSALARAMRRRLGGG